MKATARSLDIPSVAARVDAWVRSSLGVDWSLRRWRRLQERERVALAPELSGLGHDPHGRHHRRAEGAGVFRSGTPAPVRLQSSGGAARVPGGGAAGSAAGDGALGRSR